MTSFSRSGDADEVIRLFRELMLWHPTPNALCYNTLINSLAVANRYDHVDKLFDEMVASGVAPTTASYTILLKSRSFDPNFIEYAYRLIPLMVQSGCQPDTSTYTMLIAGLCRARRMDEAWGVLDQMVEDKLLPTVQSYTCIVQGYCSEGRIKEAKRLVARMEGIGCPPDVVTHGILIEALCEAGEFHEVEKLLMESEKKGWKPNEVIYNIYMNGFCKAGKIDESFRLLEVMLTNELHPTIVTLNILFECLCRDSKVWEAKCLLERSAQLGWDPDVFFYNSLMSRFCKMNELVCVLKLFNDLFKKGISPDSCTFTIVIRSLCKAGMLQRAKCLFSNSSFAADVVAFNTLLHEFYRAQEFNEVRALYIKMISENIIPNKFTYCMMIDTLCRERRYMDAIDCFLRSLMIGFFPDLVIRLNNWLVKDGKLREILNLAEGLLCRGLVIDVSVFSALIRALCKEGYCKSNDLDRVCLLLERMLGMK
ncbi:pentatricopeptide repeat-containing protein At5g65560-like [Zingiber officinale]|nr:pentatricopeptide repeat-containing protein At5g65560-like [Zingiber officinale]